MGQVEARQQTPAAGLVKRGLDTVRTAFDERQSTPTRIRAAGTVAVAVGGPVVGAVLGADVLNTVDPNIWNVLGPFTATTELTALSVGGAAVLTSAIGAIVIKRTDTGYYGDAAAPARYRNNLRTASSRVKTAALLATGISGVIAAGLGGGAAAHLGHLHAGAQVMEDLTLAGGITAAIAHINQKAWSKGLPPLRRTLGE